MVQGVLKEGGRDEGSQRRVWDGSKNLALKADTFSYSRKSRNGERALYLGRIDTKFCMQDWDDV